MELKPGMKLKDNDSRMGARTLRITKIMTNGVEVVSPLGFTMKILTRRIHTDGKARKSGFDLVGE